MSTSWVLLLAACFSGEELWVYVEDDPQDQSQHVLDALQTPIPTLKERFPSPACQKYIFKLSCLRHDLREQCTIHLLTRDEARIRSDIDLPGYSFNSRDFPKPLHPDVYYHWQSVPEHLRYLSQIREYGLQQEESYLKWSLTPDFKVARNWFRDAVQEQSYIGQIDGVTYEIVETTVQKTLKFPPQPPIRLPPLPRTVTRVFRRNSTGFSEDGRIISRYNEDTEPLVELVKAIDMGTGIIDTNPKEPE